MRGQIVSLRQARNHLSIYLFILPGILLAFTFMYYPVLNGVYHSVFDWNGGDVERFNGLQNYSRLISENATFWIAFSNALILGLANVAKMIPAIITAVCLNRVKNARLQYFYRVCFVVPMVIPGLVTVLLWKAIFDPAGGALNLALTASGMQRMLNALSAASARIGSAPPGMEVWFTAFTIGLLLAVAGGAVMSGRAGVRGSLWGYLAGLAVFLCASAGGGIVGSMPATLAGVVLVYHKNRTTMNKRVALAVITGALVGAYGSSELLGWTVHAFRRAGEMFTEGRNPAWLGSENLAFVSLVLWGFPWVASLDVLVYLACLQTIGKEVYEAAEVDGANWFDRFVYIELPFVLRQVRVMMILVIVGSINDVAMVILLFGIEGGPGGVVQMPALFMFREAFYAQAMGSACAIGVILCLIVVLATRVNQWLVKAQD